MKLCIFILLLSLSLNASPKKKYLVQPKNRNPASVGGETVTIERITQIENLRIPHDPYLLSALYHPNPKIVKASLLAIARIGDPYAIDELQRLLNRKNPEIQKYAAFALGMIGNEIAVKILEQQLGFQKNSEVIASVLLNIGRAGKEKNLPLLTKNLETATDPKVQDATCEGIGLLLTSSTDKWKIPETLLPRLFQLTQTAEPASYSCAFALSRYKGDPALIPTELILKNIIHVNSPYAKAFIAKLLGKSKTPEAFQWLTKATLIESNPAIRIEAIRALKSSPLNEDLTKTLQALMSDARASIVVSAMETAGSFHPPLPLQDAINEVLKKSKSFWVRRQALILLSKVNFTHARTLAMEILKYPGSPMYGAALSVMTQGSSSDLDATIPFIGNNTAKPLSEFLDALSLLATDKLSSAFKENLKVIVLRNDPGLTTQVAQLAEQFKWKEFGELLGNAYKHFPGDDMVEVKVAILGALNAIGNKSLAPFVEPALSDGQKSVVVAAVQTIKTLTGRDESAKIPLNSRVLAEVPKSAAIQTAQKATVSLKTSRGDIQFKMLPDAPVTVFEFVRFMKEKFYKNKTFHRVVPNFVVQGGDPRGDGYGGPGFLIRDEVSPRRHLPGTVGIATAGKDTGGCQFFINLSPNLHLDGRYTVFAEITKGLDVAQALEIGDEITGTF